MKIFTSKQFATGTAVAVIGVSACSSNNDLTIDSTTSSQQTSTPVVTEDQSSVSTVVDALPSSTDDPPPPETGRHRMDLERSIPVPGEEVSLLFAEDNFRGGFFYLYWWDGELWNGPLYLLMSDANGRAPTAWLIGEDEIVMDDYGVGGPGPDRVILPEDLAAGYWRICTANARDSACAQFSVHHG